MGSQHPRGDVGILETLGNGVGAVAADSRGGIGVSGFSEIFGNGAGAGVAGGGNLALAWWC